MSRREKQGDLKLQLHNLLIERQKHYRRYPDSTPPLPGTDPNKPINPHEVRAVIAAQRIIPIVEIPVFHRIANEPNIRGKERGKMLREALSEARDVISSYKPSRRPMQEPLRQTPTPPESNASQPQQAPETSNSQEVAIKGRGKPRVVEYAAGKAKDSATRFRTDKKYRRKVYVQTGKLAYSVTRAVHEPTGTVRLIKLGFIGAKAAFGALSTIAHDHSKQKALEAGIDEISLSRLAQKGTELVGKRAPGVDAGDIKKITLALQYKRARTRLEAAQQEAERVKAIKAVLDYTQQIQVVKN